MLLCFPNVREPELRFFTPCRVFFASDSTGVCCIAMIYPTVIDSYVDGFDAGALLHMEGLRKVTLTATDADRLASRGKDGGMHIREVTHLGRQLKTQLRMLGRNVEVRVCLMYANVREEIVP